MQHTNRLAVIAFGVAIALGILGDVLLRVSPWGVNVPLYAAAVRVACSLPHAPVGYA